VFYLFYLKRKNQDDYTGIEYYVSEKFKSRNTDWFPIQNTNYLGSLPSPVIEEDNRREAYKALEECHQLSAKLIDSLKDVYSEVQGTRQESPDRKSMIKKIHQNQLTKQNQYWEHLAAMFFMEIDNRFQTEMKNLQLKIGQRDEEGKLHISKLQEVLRQVSKLAF